MNSNRYARFFIALFFIFAATAIFRWVLLRNTPYTYMDSEYPYWMQQKDYVHTKSNEQEVIFLGDSKMKAGIIPEKICDNAYNLAIGGGSTLEMYYSLKDYLKFHPKPKTVVMGFGGLHYQYEDCFKTRNHYFHFLPMKTEFEAHFINYKLKVITLKQFQNEIIDSLKYFLLFPQKYSAACIGSKFTREEFNRSQYKMTEQNKGHMFFGMAKANNDLNIEAFQTFEINPRNDYYFHAISTLCRENDIQLFITQPPVNSATWEKMNENGHYPAFQEYLKKLSEETGIQIEWNIPHYPPEFFGDGAHLNAQGAARFSTEIKEKYNL